MVAASKDLSGTSALCVGGSQGIGSGAAVQFAKQNASVIIVGRNEELLKGVVEDLKKASPSGGQGKTFDYVVADLSTVKGIKSAVKAVESKCKNRGGGLQYIVQTQGATPTGTYTANEDGLDTAFTVQVLSRFAFPYLLAKSGTFKGSVVSVCAPGGTEVDVGDLDLGKAKGRGEYGRGLRDMLKAANRDSTIVDAFTLEFKHQFPACSAAHLFPGIVTSTGALRNFPWPLPSLLSLASAPFAYTGIMHTPATFGHIPVNLATSASNGLFKKPDTPVTPSGWIKNQTNRKAVWDGLVNMLK
ncbi:hypothetical protein DFJ77DRAFT_514416 [Powellomyces hirtus]|nr:hypothetical protein DFJ77DRAFT_514416 [Powellomyces hirtus]